MMPYLNDFTRRVVRCRGLFDNVEWHDVGWPVDVLAASFVVTIVR